MGIDCRYPYKKMPVVSAFPDHIQTNSIHKHDRPASLNHENNFTRGHGNRSLIGQTPRHSSRNSFARSNTSYGGFSGSGEFSLATSRSQKNCMIRESASSLDSIRPCSHPFILMLTNSSTRGYLKWRFSTRIVGSILPPSSVRDYSTRGGIYENASRRIRFFFWRFFHISARVMCLIPSRFDQVVLSR